MHITDNILKLESPSVSIDIPNRDDFALTRIVSTTFSRTDSYRLRIQIQGEFEKGPHIAFGWAIPPGTVLRRVDDPDIIGHSNLYSFVFKHASAENSSTDLSAGQRTVILEPHAVTMTRSQISSESKLTVFYFFNGLDRGHFAYSDPLYLQSETKESLSFGDTSLAHKTHGSKSLIFAQKLKIQNFDCFFGSTPAESQAGGRNSFLLCQGDFPGGFDFAFEIGRLLSFLTGAEMLPIGCRKFDSELRPNLTEFWNLNRDDLAAIRGADPLPLIPIGIADQERPDLTRTLSSLIENHFARKDEFKLSMIYWHLIQFHYLPFELQLHPLATALDTLKILWFQSSRSTSHGKDLADEAYGNVFRDIEPELRKKLGEGPVANAIISRIQGANQMSGNEKNNVMFAEMGIHLSKGERELVRFRNVAIHGSINRSDSQERFANTYGFRSFLGRIILTLLKYDGPYVDYATIGFPSRQISEGIQLGKPGSTI